MFSWFYVEVEEDDEPNKKVKRSKVNKVKPSVLKTVLFFISITVLNVPTIAISLGLIVLFTTSKLAFTMNSNQGFYIVIGLPILVCSPTYLLGYLLGNKLDSFNRWTYCLSTIIVFCLILATYGFLSINYL